MDAIAKDMETKCSMIRPARILSLLWHIPRMRKRSPSSRQKWKGTSFPEHDIFVDPLSLVVSSHIGPGALAVTCTKKLTSF